MSLFKPRNVERVAIFIDGANTYAASKAAGYELDYRSVLDYYQKKYGIVHAYYYTALEAPDIHSPVRQLADWLDFNGYMVRTKPTKEFFNSDGDRKIKGNMDVDLVVDAMKLAPHIDRLILFSGDGDFKPLLQAVQEIGVHTTVVSALENCRPRMVADELRRQTNAFIDLHTMRPYWERGHRSISKSDRALLENGGVEI